MRLGLKANSPFPLEEDGLRALEPLAVVEIETVLLAGVLVTLPLEPVFVLLGVGVVGVGWLWLLLWVLAL
jgi:hypothetical protein